MMHVTFSKMWVCLFGSLKVSFIHSRAKLLTSQTPKPEKIVLNLTTSVSTLKFNPTSEILSMTSEATDNAIKLMHLPSMTVFSNFPGFNLNLKRINSIDFSLNGGYLGVGNNRGAANLFRLGFYLFIVIFYDVLSQGVA